MADLITDEQITAIVTMTRAAEVLAKAMNCPVSKGMEMILRSSQVMQKALAEPTSFASACEDVVSKLVQ
jgi:hypothetical protein